MRKLALVLIVLFFMPVAAMAAQNYHSKPPRAWNTSSFVSVGSQNSTFWMASDTDGTWQAVTLPASTECKTVLIQVHDGVDTTYDPDIGNAPFLFSSESDGTGWIRVGSVGIGQSIGKIQANGGIIGYVKAASGNKVAVIILY